MAMLKIREIADTLRVSSVTVRRWIQTGVLPGIAVGSTYRVSTEDMDRFVKANHTRQGESNV